MSGNSARRHVLRSRAEHTHNKVSFVELFFDLVFVFAITQRSLTTGLTVEDVKAWPDILQRVTPADVEAAAARLFDKKRAVPGYLSQNDAEQTAAPETETTR